MPKTPDIQKVFAVEVRIAVAHSKAQENRDRWAYMARDLHAAGEHEKARRALAKADYWQRRMAKIRST